MKTIKCTDCDTPFEHTLDNFYDSGTGLRKVCKKCHAQRVIKRKQALSKYSHQWYVYRYHKKATDSRRRGKDWTLSLKKYIEILNAPRCTYCGFLFPEDWAGQRIKTIDRVRQDIGYTDENSVACCHKCNSLKGSSDIGGLYLRKDELIENVTLIEKIIEEVEGQENASD